MADETKKEPAAEATAENKEKPAEPSQNPVAEEETTAAPKPAEEAAKPEKKTLLSKLKKASPEEKAEKSEGKVDTNRDGYVSAREAINALNTGMVVESPSEDEVIAQEVAKQLEKQAEYFVVRVRKSKMVLTLGLIVLILWLVPLTLFLQNKYNFSLLALLSTGQVSQATPTPSPIFEPTPTPLPAIRIKAATGSAQLETVRTILAGNGFAQVNIELGKVSDRGIGVAVKNGQTELQKRLLALLTPTYPKATASAVVLSDDSDFSAVIILGK